LKCNSLRRAFMLGFRPEKIKRLVTRCEFG
jgi:hypothetical protein